MAGTVCTVGILRLRESSLSRTSASLDCITTLARRSEHRVEAEEFYCSLAGQTVRVGMEACGHYPWFERLLAELGFELWLGMRRRSGATVVRQQKTDRRDAEHMLDLLRESRFPRRQDDIFSAPSRFETTGFETLQATSLRPSPTDRSFR